MEREGEKRLRGELGWGETGTLFCSSLRAQPKAVKKVIRLKIKIKNKQTNK